MQCRLLVAFCAAVLPAPVAAGAFGSLAYVVPEEGRVVVHDGASLVEFSERDGTRCVVTLVAFMVKMSAAEAARAEQASADERHAFQLAASASAMEVLVRQREHSSKDALGDFRRTSLAGVQTSTVGIRALRDSGKEAYWVSSHVVGGQMHQLIIVGAGPGAARCDRRLEAILDSLRPAPGAHSSNASAPAGGLHDSDGFRDLSCAKAPKKLRYDAAKRTKWIAQARKDGFTVLGVAHACAYGFLYQNRPLTQQAKAARSYTEKQREQEMRKYGIDPNPFAAVAGGDLLLLVEDDTAPDVRTDQTYVRALYPRGWMSQGYVAPGNVQWLEEVEN